MQQATESPPPMRENAPSAVAAAIASPIAFEPAVITDQLVLSSSDLLWGLVDPEETECGVGAAFPLC